MRTLCLKDPFQEKAESLARFRVFFWPQWLASPLAPNWSCPWRHLSSVFRRKHGRRTPESLHCPLLPYWIATGKFGVWWLNDRVRMLDKKNSRKYYWRYAINRNFQKSWNLTWLNLLNMIKNVSLLYNLKIKSRCINKINNAIRQTSYCECPTKWHKLEMILIEYS